jgi:hypothetical protein
MPNKLSPDTVNRIKTAIAENGVLRDMARYVTDYANDPRYLELHRKEGYFRGWAYDGRPYDWAGNRRRDVSLSQFGAWTPSSNEEVPPSRVRKPDAQYHLARIITNRFVTLLMGESRFPRISVPKDKNTELWANQVIEDIEMQASMMEAATEGGNKGSVIVMFKLVDGAFELECFNTKYCNIEWVNFAKGKMSAFTVSYPFNKQEYDEKDEKWVTKLYLYRRMVTEQFDVEFKPAELMVKGGSYVLKDPKALPELDPDKTTFHDLGFCPARFIQNLPRYDEVDGDASAELAYELIDRINENLSGINAATQGNLDPTLVLKMTPDDFRRLEETGGPIQQGSDGYALVVGATGDAKYIEITCAGIEVAMKIIDKMREWALEMCDCIIADPHKLSGAAQSDSAISKLYAPMLSKLGLMRIQYGRAIRGLLADMIAAYHAKSAVQVTEEGPVVHTFTPVEVLDPQTQSVVEVKPKKGIKATDIKTTWGRYFEPSANDVFQYTEAAVMAAGGKAVTTQAQGARFLAGILGDPSVETTIVKLEKETEDAQKLAEKAATASPARPPSVATEDKVKT